MNFLHLKWALEVEQTGSITVAANNLHIAQSNLSNAIKSLESDVGISIFARHSKGVEVTMEGRSFLELARIAVYNMDVLEKKYIANYYVIAVNRHCTFIGDAIAKTMSRPSKKEFYFRIKEGSHQSVLDSVFSGEALFGVTYMTLEYEKDFHNELMAKTLKEKAIMECGNYALISKKHPLAQKESVTPEDFRAYTECGYPENDSRNLPFSFQRKVAGLYKGAHQIGVYDRATLYHILSSSINGYFWTGLVNRHDLANHGLVLKKCNDELKRRFSFVYPEATLISDSTKKLMSEIENSAKKLLL